MAKAGDGDAGDEIEIAVAFIVEQIAALAALEINIGAVIDRHQNGHIGGFDGSRQP